MLNAVKVGADPEVFLASTKHKNALRWRSAHPYIPGTKESPHKLKHGAIQLDGTALEFNINPATTRTEFASNIHNVLEEIKGFVPKDHELAFVPAINYAPSIWKTIPDKHKELGCDPDYSALNNGNVNPRPEDIGTLRTGSGHLHIGWGENIDVNSEEHKQDCVMFCQNMHRWFNMFENFWDKDRERKKLYGAGGAFRPKSYGVEYRGLSNAWLNHPQLWPWLFDSCQFVFNETLAGRYVDYRSVVHGGPKYPLRRF